MGSPVLATPISSVTTDIKRRSANYHPSIWGDYFLAHASAFMNPNATMERRIVILKEEVQEMLSNATNKPVELVKLIESIQRLGVAYHFQNQIEKALQSLCDSYHDYGSIGLDVVALIFRSLRQHGFNASSDVFKKFKDENGEFKQELKNDARGLLFLYESSHLRVQGEEIVDKALEYSSTHLSAMLQLIDYPLREEVKHSLEVPFHKGMPRLEARHYISLYEADDKLLELAKLDFNMLQALHQREITDISRWWKNIDITTKLPFARDRLVECYFWILGVHFEPKYSFSRKYMSKIIALASVIDDIYDVYGTLEELELFTDAIERWDLAKVDELPYYIQVCFNALLDVVKETEDKLIKEERFYCIYYAKQAIKGLVRAYMTEAKWFYSGYIPTFKEYLDVSVMSSGYPMLAVESIVGMGDLATKEALDWMLNVPEILRASALIARLVDDIQTYKVEQQRGDAPSGVQCYMNEYGVSEEEACMELKKMVNNAWLTINHEIITRPKGFNLQIILPILNFARMMVVFYQVGDGYTNSKGRTKERIASLLVHHIT